MPLPSARRSLFFRLSSMLVVSWLSSGCGEEPGAPALGDPGGAGGGGTAGATGGSGGANAGSGGGGSPAAGSSGVAGQSAGGTAGASGQGAGGDAGMGGNAGQAGDAGMGGLAGGAGEAGAGGLGGSGNEAGAGAGGDAGGGDAGGSDTGGASAGGSDAGGTDAGGSDAGGSDTGGSDAGGTDAGGSDAGGQGGGGGEAGNGGVGGAPEPCEPKSYRCTGDDLERCEDGGQGYIKVVTCPISGLCDAVGGQCDVCKPGSSLCQAPDTRSVCSEDGQEMQAAPCDVFAPICVSKGGSASCVQCVQIADCLAQATECAAAACSSEGLCTTSPLPKGTPCGVPGQGASCDGAGACQECTPGETRCQGATPGVCDASGHWQSGADCGGNQPFCSAGVCVGCLESQDCPTPANECASVLCSANKTCDTSLLSSGTPCAGGAGTCDGAGQCNLCQPGSKVCNGQQLLVCSETGTYNTPITCGGSTPYCDAANPKCVQCTSASQCSQPSNPCLQALCNGNLCGVGAKTDGSACSVGGESGSCSAGTCRVCNEGAKRCKAGATNAPQLCDASGQWSDLPACSSGMTCSGGACLSCGDGAHAGMVSNLGAISYWSMDETGSTFFDGIGGRNGSAVGTFSKGVTGLLLGGKAASLSGAGAVSVPYSSALASASFTVAAWVKVNGMAGSTRDIVSTRTLNQGWELRVGGANLNQFQMTTFSPGKQTVLNGPVFQLGTTYFVAGSYDSATGALKLYVDGELAGTTITPTVPSSSPFDIGQIYDGQNKFIGVIDDVSFFDHALNDQDIKSLHGSGACVCTPGSVACNGNQVLACNASGQYDPPQNCGGSTPYCDAANPKCVQCTSASQCSQPSNPCLQALCNGNLCGVGAKTDGSACSVGGESGSCSAGTCRVCNEGAKRCKAGATNAPQLCDASGQWSDQAVCGASQLCSAGNCVDSMTSCSAVKSLYPGAPDGLYTIDPDGSGPIPSAKLFCDMSSEGSTLVANIFDSSGDDCPNDTSYVVSGWQQTGNGSWSTPASTVNRDSTGIGSAAVGLEFVAALKANAGQKHLKICLVQPNGSDGVCRGSAAGSISLVYNADTANPKLTQYAGNTLVYTFGRLAGLAGTKDGYNYNQLIDGGASIPKTPGAQNEFGTSNVLAEYPGASYFGVWHGGGYGISYRPSRTDSEEVGPSTQFSGFRLYISP